LPPPLLDSFVILNWIQDLSDSGSKSGMTGQDISRSGEGLGDQILFWFTQLEFKGVDGRKNPFNLTGLFV